MDDGQRAAIFSQAWCQLPTVLSIQENVSSFHTVAFDSKNGVKLLCATGNRIFVFDFRENGSENRETEEGDEDIDEFPGELPAFKYPTYTIRFGHCLGAAWIPGDSAAFVVFGRQLQSQEYMVHLYDANEHACVFSYRVPGFSARSSLVSNTVSLNQLTLSLGGPNGFYLSIAFSDLVTVVDLEAGSPVWALKGTISSAHFFPGAPYIIAVANTAGQLRFYDVRVPPGQCLALLEIPVMEKEKSFVQRRLRIRELQKNANRRIGRVAKAISVNVQIPTSMSTLIAASEVAYDMLGSELLQTHRDRLYGCRTHYTLVTGRVRPLTVARSRTEGVSLPRKSPFVFKSTVSCFDSPVANRPGSPGLRYAAHGQTGRTMVDVGRLVLTQKSPTATSKDSRDSVLFDIRRMAISPSECGLLLATSDGALWHVTDPMGVISSMVEPAVVPLLDSEKPSAELLATVLDPQQFPIPVSSSQGVVYTEIPFTWRHEVRLRLVSHMRRPLQSIGHCPTPLSLRTGADLCEWKRTQWARCAFETVTDARSLIDSLTLPSSHANEITALGAHPRLSILATGAKDGRVLLWGLATQSRDDFSEFALQASTVMSVFQENEEWEDIFAFQHIYKVCPCSPFSLVVAMSDGMNINLAACPPPLSVEEPPLGTIVSELATLAIEQQRNMFVALHRVWNCSNDDTPPLIPVTREDGTVDILPVPEVNPNAEIDEETRKLDEFFGAQIMEHYHILNINREMRNSALEGLASRDPATVSVTAAGDIVQRYQRMLHLIDKLDEEIQSQENFNYDELCGRYQDVLERLKASEDHARSAITRLSHEIELSTRALQQAHDISWEQAYE